MNRAPPTEGAAAPADQVRILGFAFDRLTLRFAVGVALLVVLPLSAGLALLAQRDYDRAVAGRRSAAELQNRVLEVALRHQMVEKDPALMTSILHEIAAQPDVRGAMILNHEGEVRMASDAARVGARLDRDSPACMVCHAKEPAARDRWALLDEGGERVLRSVLPIRNEPECHACHRSNARMNGILVLDVSLAEVQAAFRREVGWMVAGTAALALLVFGGVGLFVRRLVLSRLAQLGRTARTIAGGDLAVRAPVHGGDVIASLAADFNRMAESVSELLAEIRRHEARLANIVNSLEDGLVVLDGSSRIVACNRSFGRRLDVAPDEARGRACHDAGAGRLPCCVSGVDCPAAKCLETGRVQRVILRSEGRGGERRRVDEVYASPVTDEDGRVTQVVEIWRDITERVEEEERLAEIERMVSLGVLASGFSHEVNTPLATMLTCADSVLGRIDDAECDRDETLAAVRESALTIRQQVLRCRRITDEFLRFSRGIPPSIELFDLQDKVTEVIALARPTAREHGVEIRMEPCGALPFVRANTEVVHHVVLNLLVNAIQSCNGRGGTIVAKFLTGDDVRLELRDTGCGIAPEDGRHLFEPFRSRKPQGTGLGLFLSRSFMRRFGGDVRLVESEPGRGSCFQVVFGRADAVTS